MLLATTFIAAIAACNADTENPATDNRPDTGRTSAPVGTKNPNSQYKPAFAGQTRAPGVKTKTPLSVTVINSTLQQPWGIHTLPDGRFQITEKGGDMLTLKANGKPDKKITGWPAVLAQGQGGLLDVNIDPDFTNNKMIYWDYAEQTPEGSLLAVSKGKLSADESKVENIKVIYRATPAYKGAARTTSV